jgi:LPS-assembly protein
MTGGSERGAARAACLLLMLGLLLVLVLPAAARAERAIKEDKPVNIVADELAYDEEIGVLTAKGNVEITQDKRSLYADVVSYNERSDVLTASGDVILLEEDGAVIFADFFEVTSDLKNGIIRKLGIILTDNSRFAANSARRLNGNTTVMTKAVYTPCYVCLEDKENGEPFWQVKARKIIHDQEAKEVIYRDATLEVKGVPIMYTPWLSHPDPSVKRRSGLLAPEFFGSSDVGTGIRWPVFWAISGNRDMTATPILTTSAGQGLGLEYRQAFNDGYFNVSGTGVADDPEKDFRGHVFANARYHFDDTWRGGFNLRRSTDDTYLRRYDITSAQTLESNIFLEGFSERSYAAVNFFAYQELRQNLTNDAAPLITPVVDYNLRGKPGRYGGRLDVDANFLVLTRIDGTDSRRLSVEGAYVLPYVAPAGDAYRLTASLRGDVYSVDDHVIPGETSDYNGVTGRVHPYIAGDWRWPFVRRETPRVMTLVEPIIGVVAAPDDNNPDEIPNEDSLTIELDETNLFSHNRFPGLDRVEGGVRVTYGMRFGLFGAGGGSSTAFIGQSYRVGDAGTFGLSSGLKDDLSDIVGNVLLTPSENWDMLYRYRIDPDGFKLRRSEFLARVGPPALNLRVQHVYVADIDASDEFGERNQLRAEVNSRLTDEWSVRGFYTGDLDNGGSDLLTAGAAVTYENCCFIFDGQVERTRFNDRDVDPQWRLLLRFVFKSLGSFGATVQ